MQNITVRPKLLDIICFRLYCPYKFVLGDHAWPQNTTDKSTTNITNKASYQIITRRCRILQFTFFKESDNLVGITGRSVRQALVPNVTAQPSPLDIVCSGPYRPHGFVFDDHTWPQNASNKLATSTTNEVSYQILPRVEYYMNFLVYVH